MKLPFFKQQLQLLIPNETLPLLLMQRTRTRNLLSSGDIAELSEKNLSSFKEEAAKVFFNDFKQFETYLPKKIDSFLDIGCGLGFLDVLIFKNYKNQAYGYLIDKTKVEKDIWYGFKEKSAFYNSLEKTGQVLELNNIPQEKFNLLDADQTPFHSISNKCDLIVSFLSWGWHYPLETYLDQVLNIAHKETVLIVDIRKDSNGIDLLKKSFNKLVLTKDFMNSSKGFRVVCSDKK